MFGKLRQLHKKIIFNSIKFCLLLIINKVENLMKDDNAKNPILQNTN